jgi:uncharacterized protein YerC
MTAVPMHERTRRMGVASMLRDGAGIEEVADILGLTVAAVRIDAIIDAVVDHHRPAADIAREIGVSRAYASRVARAHGARVRERIAEQVAARQKRVAAARQRSTTALARRERVSVRTIRIDRERGAMHPAKPRAKRRK